MPTPGTDGTGLGAAAKQVAERAGAIARLELELAQLELKQKIASLGAGIALAVVAGVFALFALGFGLAAAAAGFATFLPTWLALLIVFGILLLLALVLGLLGLRRIKRGTPPVPEQAIAEAKQTSAALKSHGA
jgi:membrane protein implicated in regulation of membrane protease activity